MLYKQEDIRANFNNQTKTTVKSAGYMQKDSSNINVLAYILSLSKRGIIMNRKAQGISINVIVAAAIGLLVLVVLAAIFMGRLGAFTHQSVNCEQMSGKCAYTCENDPSGFTKEYKSAKCFTADGKEAFDKVCCVPGS